MVEYLVGKVKSVFVAARRLFVVTSRRAATSPYLTTQTLNNSFLILSSAIAASLIGYGTGAMSLIESILLVGFGIGSSMYSLNHDFPEDLQDDYGRMLQG